MTSRTGPHAGATRPGTVAVLLAAGGGTRWRGAGHKLAAMLPPTAREPAQTVFERSLGRLLDAAVGPVVVVTGALTAGDLPLPVPPADPPAAPARPDLTTRDEVVVAVEHNPRWQSGQITSVHAGLRAARRLGATRVVIGLADQPSVTAAAWRAVAAADHPISVATYEGRRGNPVGLDEGVWDLLPDAGDEGARALMRVRPDLVGEVPCTGSPADIDTEEDLRRWQNN